MNSLYPQRFKHLCWERSFSLHRRRRRRRRRHRHRHHHHHNHHHNEIWNSCSTLWMATGWTTWLRLPSRTQILSRLSLGPNSKHGVQLVRGRKCLELHLHFLLRLHDMLNWAARNTSLITQRSIITWRHHLSGYAMDAARFGSTQAPHR